MSAAKPNPEFDLNAKHVANTIRLVDEMMGALFNGRPAPRYNKVTPEMWEAIERDQKIDEQAKRILRRTDWMNDFGEITADGTDAETICLLVAEGKEAEAGAHFVGLLKSYVRRSAEHELIERGEIEA